MMEFFKGLKKSKTERELDKWDKIVQKNPQFDAFFGRGQFQFSLGNYQAAINDYTKALERTPSDHPYLIYARQYRGLAYLKLGRYSDALADFNNLIPCPINLQPVDMAKTNAANFYYRGVANEKMGRIEEAKRDYEISMQHSANETYAHYQKENHTEAIGKYLNYKLSVEYKKSVAELMKQYGENVRIDPPEPPNGYSCWNEYNNEIRRFEKSCSM